MQSKVGKGVPYPIPKSEEEPSALPDIPSNEVKPVIGAAPQGSVQFGTVPYSGLQVRQIEAQLSVPLGRDEVKNRAGPGRRQLTYIEGWRAIDIANSIFGFQGWSCEIGKLDVRSCRQTPDKRWYCCVMATVRVTLQCGTFHEDRGGGHAENKKSQEEAQIAAEKEAVTDARKRALKNFGRRLGLSLYSDEHLRSLARGGIVTKSSQQTRTAGRAPLRQAQQGHQQTTTQERSVAQSSRSHDDPSPGIPAGKMKPSPTSAIQRKAPVRPQPPVVKQLPMQSGPHTEKSPATAAHEAENATNRPAALDGQGTSIQSTRVAHETRDSVVAFPAAQGNCAGIRGGPSAEPAASRPSLSSTTPMQAAGRLRQMHQPPLGSGKIENRGEQLQQTNCAQEPGLIRAFPKHSSGTVMTCVSAPTQGKGIGKAGQPSQLRHSHQNRLYEQSPGAENPGQGRQRENLSSRDLIQPSAPGLSSTSPTASGSTPGPSKSSSSNAVTVEVQLGVYPGKNGTSTSSQACPIVGGGNGQRIIDSNRVVNYAPRGANPSRTLPPWNTRGQATSMMPSNQVNGNISAELKAKPPSVDPSPYLVEPQHSSRASPHSSVVAGAQHVTLPKCSSPATPGGPRVFRSSPSANVASKPSVPIAGNQQPSALGQFAPSPVTPGRPLETPTRGTSSVLPSAVSLLSPGRQHQRLDLPDGMAPPVGQKLGMKRPPPVPATNTRMQDNRASSAAMRAPQGRGVGDGSASAQGAWFQHPQHPVKKVRTAAQPNVGSVALNGSGGLVTSSSGARNAEPQLGWHHRNDAAAEIDELCALYAADTE